MKKVNISLLVTILLVSMVAVAQVPTNGLIAYYPFSGNANDASGNSLNGTNHNATLTTDRFGNPNAAYEFNGSNSYIEVANNSLLNITGKISISAWFNTYDLTGLGRIVDKITVNQSNGYLLDMNGTAGNKRLRMLVAGPGHSGFSRSLINQDSTWYYVVATYDSTEIKFYINGSLDTTIATTGATPVNNLPLRIGANSTLVNNFFKGKIDDVAIYNRVLTSAEITGMYGNAGCAVYDTIHLYDTTHVTIYDTVFTPVAVSDTLLIDVNITGINPPNNLNKVAVYPNPAKDHLIIDNGNFALMTGYSLKITNANGQIVFNQPVTQQQFSVDLSTWGGAGVYLLYIIDAQSAVKSIKEIVLQ